MRRIENYLWAPPAITTTVLFDVLVTYNSAVPFRMIYDAALFVIFSVIFYCAILLLRNRKMSEEIRIIVIRRKLLILPLVVNLASVFLVASNISPEVGTLNENTLMQGIDSLLPLAFYLTLMLTNGFVIRWAVGKNGLIRVYELPTYAVAVIAIETSVASYSFAVGGIGYLRLGLALFHLCFSGIVGWLYVKNTASIKIGILRSDALLALLSIGIFALVFAPHGIYSLFGDSAINVGSSLSIMHRGVLQPYYNANDYYPPINGFVSTVFAYVTGVGNVLLASSLPFLSSILLFPFVTFHFLKKHVADNLTIVVIGTVMAILMDGLAVIYLQPFLGNITRTAIEWQISPATKSLYWSTTSWLWLNSYKVMGLVAATAFGAVIQKKNVSSLLLAGILIGFSFVDLRTPFLAILLALYLMGIGRMGLKQNALVFLAAVMFLGPMFPEVIFKNLSQLSFFLGKTGPFAEQAAMFYPLYGVLSAFLIPTLAACLVLTIVLILRNHYRSKVAGQAIHNKTNDKPEGLMTSKRHKVRSISLFTRVFIVSGLMIFAYIVFHAYDYSTFSSITRGFISPLNYTVLRYHILIPLLVFGPVALKLRRKMAISITLILSLFCLSLALFGESNQLGAGLVLVALALPTVGSLVKFKRRSCLVMVLFFLLLGVFSAQFYSATVISGKSDPIYSDLPFVLDSLLKMSADEKVSLLASYSYFANRTIRMASLIPTNNLESHIQLVDKKYADSVLVESLLENKKNKVIYQGEVFVLFENNMDSTKIGINSDFEHGVNNPSNWTAMETNQSHRANWDNITRLSGNHSLNLSVDENSGQSWVRWESDTLSVPDKTTVLFLNYAVKQQLSLANSFSIVQIDFYDLKGVRISQNRTFETSNTDWAQKTAFYCVPDDTSGVKIFLVNRGEGNVWFDDVRLTAYY